jgi:hypothetical protein
MSRDCIYCLDILHIVGCSMDDSKQKHGICSLPVEPLALIEGNKRNLGSKNSDDITAHWQ